MQDGPSSPEMLEAIIALLRDRISPKVEGHDAYALRVAINSLETVKREFELRPVMEAAEVIRLEKILGKSGSVSELNSELCNRIRSGDFDLNNKSLVEHLTQTAIDQVCIDQPRYSGLIHAQERMSACPQKNPQVL